MSHDDIQAKKNEKDPLETEELKVEKKEKTQALKLIERRMKSLVTQIKYEIKGETFTQDEIQVYVYRS